jgi:glycosyltransferase involved in cell wall biosynthesis
LALVIGQLTVGGAERQVWELVRRLDRRYVPTVYCLADTHAPLAGDLARLGVAVRTVGSPGVGRVRRLAQLLRTDQIDLVHAWLFIANGYALGAKLCGARQPLITSARNCKVQGRMSRLVNALAFRCSRAIVANSQDVAAYIVREYRAPQARIRVIQNGVDVERFRPAGESGADRRGPIVTVGRLVMQKNHDMFLRAAAMLAQKEPNARFTIVGDGPLRRTLEAQARQLRISDRVTFAGERSDVDEILRGASLFWLTSRWEGMPNVVLEAMASGVPVIATDVGGTREVIRAGVDGFVVGDQDEEAFVRLSRDLLREEARRRQFGAAARARAEEFSAARMVQMLSALYEEVLERRQMPARGGEKQFC